MKHTVLLLFFACSIYNLKAQDIFTVKGHLKNLADQEMMIMQRINYKDVELARTTCTNGSFRLTGKITAPDLVMLVIPRIDQSIPIFLEASEINIEGDMARLEEVNISGSKTHLDYLRLQAKLKPFDDEIAEISSRLKAAQKAKSREAFDEAYDKYKTIRANRDAAIVAHFESNNNSIATASFLPPIFFNEKDINKLKDILSKFGTKIRDTKHYAFFEERIAALEKLNIGKMAPEFTLNTPEGDKLALSSLRGKYVLVDFWASWCAPCRSANPHIVKLYNTYKNKSFEILGVSLDTKKEKWTNAIEADKLAWKHVSDLKGWKSDAAKIYAINSIPHTLLIDPNGRIIAKDLSPKGLELKLKELLK